MLCSCAKQTHLVEFYTINISYDWVICIVIERRCRKHMGSDDIKTVVDSIDRAIFVLCSLLMACRVEGMAQRSHVP